MPTFPVPMAFWTFLMIDSKYKEMIVKESSTAERLDNIAETREQIFSKFANLDTGSINYDDLDSFLGLFSNDFPKEYEQLVADVPRNERKQAKEKILERFSKVLEFDIGRQKRGRPKLDFEGQVAKFINSENPNLDDFYKILMEKYKSYGATKENNIKQIKKDIGSSNLRKIIAVFKENAGDIKEDKEKGPQVVSTLEDFGNPKKMQFNIMKLVIGISTFGENLPKNIAGFTQTSDNDEYLTSSNESFVTYEKLVPIEGFDLETHKKEWIKGMSKYIYTHETLKRQHNPIGTPNNEYESFFQDELRFKDDNKAKEFKLKIVYFEDVPLLREILDKKDKKVIETINFDVGEELSYQADNTPTTEIKMESYFEILEGSNAHETSNKHEYFSFRLGPPSKDTQKSQLYESTTNSKRLYYHPTLKNLFSSESSDVFLAAVEGITQKTASAYKQRPDELNKVRGVRKYEDWLIAEIFDSENLSDYPNFYAPFMDGGKLNIYPQEVYGTSEEQLNAGLTLNDKDYFTSNKKIISFVDSMYKYAFDEKDRFIERLLLANKELIAGEIKTEIAFSKPSELAFFTFLSLNEVKQIKEILISTKGDLTGYFNKKLDTNEGFSYLFSIAHLYLDDKNLESDLDKLLKGKEIFSKKGLSTEDKSLITKITSTVEQNLIKIRTNFKNKLEEMLDNIAKNPKSVPRSLFKRLISKELLKSVK